MKKKIVYVAMSADILHEGHINIINTARKYGEVIVGLLTDKAISSYKNIPTLNYKQREVVLKNIKFVKKVIPQHTLDYRPNLKILKPNYVIHGDDWKIGPQKETRKQVISTLRKWGGKLVEPKYTENISSTDIKTKILSSLSPNNRVSILKRLIDNKQIVRILEAHSPLSGLIAENIKIEKGKKINQFDGMWSSSLTDSSIKGKPDNQSLDFSSRYSGIGDLFDVTTKPLIFDADNGGRLEHLPFTVRTLERLGVSAIMIEDKVGLKKLIVSRPNWSETRLNKEFCKKIKIIKKSRLSKDFLIGARIESFIFRKRS